MTETIKFNANKYIHKKRNHICYLKTTTKKGNGLAMRGMRGKGRGKNLTSCLLFEDHNDEEEGNVAMRGMKGERQRETHKP